MAKNKTTKKAAQKAATAKWKEANPERVKELKRNWYLKNKTQILAQQKAHRELVAKGEKPKGAPRKKRVPQTKAHKKTTRLANSAYNKNYYHRNKEEQAKQILEAYERDFGKKPKQSE